MFDINLNSTVNLITESLPSLKKTSGSIVCISPIAGIEITDAPIPYSIAKSALNSYVKNSSKPLAKFDKSPLETDQPMKNWMNYLE